MKQLKSILFTILLMTFLGIISLMPSILALPSDAELSIDFTYPINYSLIPTVNSSDYWDGLDTPADITYDDISGGDVEALGYTGFFNFIQGAVGQLSINGDPWYLGGTSLEVDENLTINGNSYLSDTFPQTTLTYSLGSGALRWLNLYVQNINAEEIDAFNLALSENLSVGGNLTIGGLINGVNLTGIVSNIPEQNIVKVNQNLTDAEEVIGEAYNNIADALTYIATQTPAIDNRWALQLGAGTYTENINVPDWVWVKGAGSSATVLTGQVTSASYLTIPTTGELIYQNVIQDCQINDLRFETNVLLVALNCLIKGGSDTASASVAGFVCFDSTITGGTWDNMQQFQIYRGFVLGGTITPSFFTYISGAQIIPYDNLVLGATFTEIANSEIWYSYNPGDGVNYVTFQNSAQTTTFKNSAYLVNGVLGATAPVFNTASRTYNFINTYLGDATYTAGTFNHYGTAQADTNIFEKVGIGTSSPDAKLQVNVDGVGSTMTDGLILKNSVLGNASVTIQYAPSLSFIGNQYTSGANQEYEMRLSAPTGGSTPSFYLQLREAGGAWRSLMIIDQNGGFQTPIRKNHLNKREVVTEGIRLAYDWTSGKSTSTYDQYSPDISLVGGGWSTVDADDQTMVLSQLVAPEQGSTHPTGVYKFIYGTDRQTPIEANELLRLEWGDRLGAIFNQNNITGYTMAVNGESTLGGNVTIGSGVAGTDYTLTFDGETNDGVITWMEDEDYFNFSKSIVFNLGEKIDNLIDGVLRVTGNLWISGDLNQTSGNAYINNLYGGINYFNETGATFTFTAQNTYYNFTGGHCGLNNSVKCHNSTNYYIEIVEDGVYQIQYSATGDGLNNHKYITAVAINNVVQNDSRDIMIISATGDTHKMHEEIELDLNAGDIINLQIQDTSGTGDGTIYEWDMNAWRIGN